MIKFKTARWCLAAIMALSFVVSSGAAEKLNIMIIGDSISIGYTPHLAEMMKSKANVFHHPGNAGATRGLPEEAAEWMKMEYDGQVRKWDVVVFNYGIWDIAHQEGFDKPPRTDIKTFEKRIRAGGEMIKKVAPEAKVIWANITAIREDSDTRKAADVARYNEAVQDDMKDLGIAECDLYALTSGFDKSYYLDNLHFVKKGYMEIAGRVMESIEQALGGKK